MCRSGAKRFVILNVTTCTTAGFILVFLWLLSSLTNKGAKVARRIREMVVTKPSQEIRLIPQYGHQVNIQNYGVKTMKVTVIMPVRNDAARVECTMDSLFQQTRLPDEVVIADGCSTDTTVQRMLEYSDRGVPFKVVENPSMFCGGGRNAATQAAEHDLLVTLDLGNRADPQWLAGMVAPFEEDETLDYLGSVVHPMVDAGEYEKVSGAIIYFDDFVGMKLSRDQLQSMVGDKPIPGGASMAFRKDIWLRAGKFSEWARKGQDRLFSHRVHHLGGKVDMSVDSIMYLHMGHSIADDFNRHYLYGLWIARTGLPRARFKRLVAVYAVGAAMIGLAFLNPVFWPILALVVIGLCIQ